MSSDTGVRGFLLKYFESKNVSHGSFLFVYLSGEFFKNHFFHFMAPLDQGIKIALSSGVKLFLEL